MTARCAHPSELTPQHELVVPFESDDFQVEIPNPQEAAEIVIQRLTDSGFVIKEWEAP
jgi:hypothetical protein